MSVPVARDDSPRLYDNDKLRAWRVDAGLRLERVCADLEISASWLRELEIGTGNPSVQILARLAAYYGHQPGELLLSIA